MARKQTTDRNIISHTPSHFPPMAALQHLSSSALLPPPTSHSRFHFSPRQFILSASAAREPAPSAERSNCAVTRRQLIGGLHAAAAISLSPLGYKALAADDQLSEWERVYLPIDPGVVLLDIAFVPDDPSHG